MEIKQFLQTLKRKQKFIWLIAGSVFLLSFIITFIQPLKYGADTQLLVVQNMPASTDAYTMSRSSEYLGNVLATVVDSNSFYNEVMTAGFNIDASYFGSNQQQKTERWHSTVKAVALGDTGIIRISVYHPDKFQVEQIANAINFVMRTKNNLYHGAGDSVNIRILDEPFVSTLPVKPNIALNLLAGLLSGLALSILYIYLFKYDQHESENADVTVSRPIVSPVSQATPAQAPMRNEIPVRPIVNQPDYRQSSQAMPERRPNNSVPQAPNKPSQTEQTSYSPNNIPLAPAEIERQAAISAEDFGGMGFEEISESGDIRNIL
jgi:capsular polysaccharide biosynthesis protein